MLAQIEGDSTVDRPYKNLIDFIISRQRYGMKQEQNTPIH